MRHASSFPLPVRLVLILAPLFLAVPRPAEAGARPLPVQRQSLELPGAPSILLPVDMNADGRKDLLVAVIYTEYDEIAFERAEAYIQMTSIVPALFERREARLYLGQADGSYRLSGPPMPLPASVLTLASGPAGLPAVALTDDGLAGLSLDEAGSLRLEPLLADPPALRGASTLLPALPLVGDADGRGGLDLLLPARDGLAIYTADSAGLDSTPATRLPLPGDETGFETVLYRRYPQPSLEDIDADGLPDLFMVGEGDVTWLRGTGGGRFAPPVRIDLACILQGEQGRDHPELVHVGDVDGRGRAEVVTRLEVANEEESDIDEAKRPRALYRFHHLTPDLLPEGRPYQEIETIGHDFGDGFAGDRGTALRDLDGDSRKDLVTVTLDFSVMQVVRILATKKIGVELEFQIYSQGSDGRFTQTSSEGLTEKLLIDLNDLKLGRLSNFSADFDGNGVVEFTHLDRGRRLQVHRGGAAGRYSPGPDFMLDLDDAPEDPGLVRVLDLNGDGRSDVVVTRPLPQTESGATAAVRLDLYLGQGMP